MPLPERYKNTVVEKDYQRILDEIEADGTVVDWSDGPPKINGVDWSFAFLYPSIIKPFEVRDVQ